MKKVADPTGTQAGQLGRRGEGAGAVMLAHPSGNQFFRHLALALRDAELLTELCTTIDWRKTSWLARILPRGVAQEMARRSFSDDLGVTVAPHPFREMLRLGAARLGCRAVQRHETGYASVDAVYRDFDRWVAGRIQRATRGRLVYAYEDAAEASFLAARSRGWRTAYDLPIAYWATSRRWLEEEAQRWPEWEPTLVGTRDSAEKCERKSRELALADVIVCPSSFVAESVPVGVRAGTQVVVAPFGSPPVRAEPRPANPAAPLRVLFAGSMTQRKGLADLFAAMRLVPRRGIELFVLGSPVTEPAFYRRVFNGFIHERSRPHGEVLALMRHCDVLCLPSIVEGRALVVQEAMSVGLPVIITPNTGAADVVIDGVSGFVVPPRSPETIAARLTWLLEHREALPEMGRAAQRAAARFSWRDYGARILSALRSEIGST